VRPEFRSAKVLASSIGTFSMSNAGPHARRTFSTASAMTVSVFSPRKSIFSRPSFPTAFMSNCTVTSPSWRVSGTNSSSGLSVMRIPAACLPVLRTMPSRTRACSKIRPATGFFETSSRSSADLARACSRVMLISSGIILARRSASAYARLWTRDTSRMTIFAPSVP
jgi:hypothetical protein